MTNTDMAALLRKQADPMRPQNSNSAPKLTVREVMRVYPPDSRGLTEVLYREHEGTPMTAFMRGNELAYVVDGW